MDLRLTGQKTNWTPNFPNEQDLKIDRSSTRAGLKTSTGLNNQMNYGQAKPIFPFKSHVHQNSFDPLGIDSNNLPLSNKKGKNMADAHQNIISNSSTTDELIQVLEDAQSFLLDRVGIIKGSSENGPKSQKGKGIFWNPTTFSPLPTFSISPSHGRSSPRHEYRFLSSLCPSTYTFGPRSNLLAGDRPTIDATFTTLDSRREDNKGNSPGPNISSPLSQVMFKSRIRFLREQHLVVDFNATHQLHLPRIPSNKKHVTYAPPSIIKPHFSLLRILAFSFRAPSYWGLMILHPLAWRVWKEKEPWIC